MWIFKRKSRRTPISHGREAYFAALLALEMHEWRQTGDRVWRPDEWARRRAELLRTKNEERARVARREGWPV